MLKNVLNVKFVSGFAALGFVFVVGCSKSNNDTTPEQKAAIAKGQEASQKEDQLKAREAKVQETEELQAQNESSLKSREKDYETKQKALDEDTKRNEKILADAQSAKKQTDLSAQQSASDKETAQKKAQEAQDALSKTEQAKQELNLQKNKLDAAIAAAHEREMTSEDYNERFSSGLVAGHAKPALFIAYSSDSSEVGKVKGLLAKIDKANKDPQSGPSSTRIETFNSGDNYKGNTYMNVFHVNVDDMIEVNNIRSFAKGHGVSLLIVPVEVGVLRTWMTVTYKYNTVGAINKDPKTGIAGKGKIKSTYPFWIGDSEAKNFNADDTMTLNGAKASVVSPIFDMCEDVEFECLTALTGRNSHYFPKLTVIDNTTVNPLDYVQTAVKVTLEGNNSLGKYDPRNPSVVNMKLDHSIMVVGPVPQTMVEFLKLFHNGTTELIDSSHPAEQAYIRSPIKIQSSEFNPETTSSEVRLGKVLSSINLVLDEARKKYSNEH